MSITNKTDLKTYSLWVTLIISSPSLHEDNIFNCYSQSITMTYDASCLATFFALDEVEKSFLFYKLIINSLQIFTTGRINQFTLVHLEDVVGWSSDGCQSNISNSGSSLIFPLEGFFAVFKIGASSESSEISIYLSFLLAFIPFPIDAFFFFSETLLKW